jgi:hypothetical protein
MTVPIEQDVSERLGGTCATVIRGGTTDPDDQVACPGMQRGAHLCSDSERRGPQRVPAFGRQEQQASRGG